LPWSQFVINRTFQGTYHLRFGGIFPRASLRGSSEMCSALRVTVHVLSPEFGRSRSHSQSHRRR
jgi:hypothetical protein